MTDAPHEPKDPVLWGIGGFIAGIVVAVLALQYYGYLTLADPEGEAVVDEFRLLSLKPEFGVKVSQKTSGKLAFCESGYLLLKPQNDKQVAGILVDSKNRGIACHQGLVTTPAEE